MPIPFTQAKQNFLEAREGFEPPNNRVAADRVKPLRQRASIKWWEQKESNLRC